MEILKKDRWTEDEILALPSGESDKFDRKSGLFLSDSGFEEKLAKALSAFANSGGGHLILGVKDDGSFDGVDEFHKGRTETREWLEQKIPFLLTPNLQDFRVHDVDRSSQTQIHQGKVIIVIDIGDSNLAPHQSNKDYHYYYRAGGHSKPSPHQYLEFLWKRESYPGPNVASAWVNKVINPLLNVFKAELKYLLERKWAFDKCHPESLKGLEKIHQKYVSGNYEQFFEFYPEIYKSIQEHDKTVTVVIENLEKYYIAIKDSEAMRGIFKFTTSLESLEKLNDEKNNDWNYKVRECKSVDDFYKAMFSHLTESQIIEILAQYVINDYSKVFQNDFAPYWNVYSGNFLMLNAAGCDEKVWFESTRKNLIEIVENLFRNLKEERNSLCLKYQMPFEESQQIIM